MAIKNVLNITRDKITGYRLPVDVKKYLVKYLSGGWLLETGDSDYYNNAVVIPAISEFENIKSLLLSLASADNKYFNSTLFIFVVNNAASSGADVKNNNLNSIFLLRKIISKEADDIFTGNIIQSGLKIGLVDASTAGNEIPETTAGVGHARKIGMDLALTIFNYENKFKKILICLDADCTVEKNYLSEIIENFKDRNISSAVIKYAHSFTGNHEIENAITCYEIFLNYYELGLKYAQSPYAFHTIGSTIACDYESYIKVEGMNRKKAGEDFYFLEKLLKNTEVKKINTTVVHPAPRRSWRVPFGTGQRINRFLKGGHDEYKLYNPVSFYILKDWLEIFLYGIELTAEEYLDKAGKINKSLSDFLVSQKFYESWNRIAENSKGSKQLHRQKIRWFDGFRTLKLIHYLRDNGFPEIDMFNALDELFGKLGIVSPAGKNTRIPGIDIQKEYLKILKKITE